ncbi:MAG: GntR family transcriptional regulator [Magnetospiraceae bacterium]
MTNSKTRIEDIAESIQLGILGGTYAPGERLHVENLRTEFKVSASTVREALSRLMAESLVTTEGQRGFRVTPLSLADFREMAELRMKLEILAATRSIENGDQAWEDSLVAAYQNLSETEASLNMADPLIGQQWLHRNIAFHNALVAACDNSWMLRFRGILHRQSSRYLWFAYKDQTITRDIHAEHSAIFDASIERDKATVQKHLTIHINKTIETVTKMLTARNLH